MEDNLVQQFLKGNYTRNEAVRRFRILRDFLNYRFFETNASLPVLTNFDQFSPDYAVKNARANIETDLAFVKSLGETFLNQFKTDNVKNILSKLESNLSQAQTVILYLPFELPSREIPKMGTWFKEVLGPSALIDIQFDAELIGGCALSYKGIYKDLSIRSKIEDRKQDVLNTLMAFRK